MIVWFIIKTMFIVSSPFLLLMILDEILEDLYNKHKLKKLEEKERKMKNTKETNFVQLD